MRKGAMAKRSLRQRAMSGETLLGAMVFEFFTPGIAQIHKLAGCEYLGMASQNPLNECRATAGQSHNEDGFATVTTRDRLRRG